MVGRTRGVHNFSEGHVDEKNAHSERCSSNTQEMADGGLVIEGENTSRRVGYEASAAASVRRRAVRGGWAAAAGIFLLISLVGLDCAEGIIVDKEVRIASWNHQHGDARAAQRDVPSPASMLSYSARNNLPFPTPLKEMSLLPP